MQEEFEKKVQDRMLTFGMQPSPQVWDDIDAALGKRKHRRIFIGWWILLGLVIAGGGLLFYQKDNILHNELNQQPVPVVDSASHNNLAQTPAAATPAQKPAEETAPVTLIKPAAPNGSGDENNNATTQTYNNQHTSPSSKKAIASLSTTVVKSPATDNSPTTDNTPVNNNTANTNAPVKNSNTEPVDNTITPNSNGAEPGNPSTTPNAAIAEQPPAPQAAARDSTVIQQPAILPQAPVNAVTNQPPPDKKTAPINPKTIASSRHQWFFTVGGGTTQTTSFGSFNKTNNNGMSAPITGGNYDVVPGFTALAAQTYEISAPKRGYHLFAGLTHQYKLAKQWRLTGGLQVAYLTNKQQTGAYVKSNPIYLSANYLSQNAGTDKIYQEDYYQAGAPSSQYTVVNKAWQLQVPVNVAYVINPRAKTKVLVNAGLSAAWTLKSRWIIPDTRFDKLYYNNTVLNGTTISWQAGPAVELKNQWRFGLQYQQSFTTLAKTYVTPKLYWQNISLYAGIPFNITLKKHKK